MTLHLANRTFAAVPATLNGRDEVGERHQAQYDDARDALRAPAPAVLRSHAGAPQPQPRGEQAGGQQRPHRYLSGISGAGALARRRHTQRDQGARGIGTTFFSHLRPYSPELTGFARSLGQSTSYYDANGHYIRASATVPDLHARLRRLAGALGKPQAGSAEPQARPAAPLPGSGTQPAADGSSPFTDTGQLECNPTEVP